MAAAIDGWLEGQGFARALWLPVGFGVGIALWFSLPLMWDWLALIALCMGISLGVWLMLRPDGRLPFIREAMIAMPLMIAAGCGHIWLKSQLVGADPIARAIVTEIAGTVEAVERQPADERLRLVVRVNEGDLAGRRVRLNLRDDWAAAAPVEGSHITARARLMPPAPPMLPGSFDFARRAWFDRLSATGSIIAKPQFSQSRAGGADIWASAQRRLAGHVTMQIDGAPGSIAAALASGERGAISEADDAAMRDSGLYHLLSISGLHVSALVGMVYLLLLRTLALIPALALRVRIQLVAAAGGALAALAYTLLSGAEIPTVRSCLAALLVLAALALGRSPLSLRMVATAAMAVMILWPESVIGPSFQMSFAAVICIVALAEAGPIRRWLARRDERLWARGLRGFAMLLITGIAIEAVITPIGLYHFHRAGLYGALANLAAIPLTTFVIMPAIALGLVLDGLSLPFGGGGGAPAWWLADQALELLLALARFVSAQPGATSITPQLGGGAFAAFIAGGLWLALWSGKVRLAGLIPAGWAAATLFTLDVPDVIVSGDGRHVGITLAAQHDAPARLLVLRDSSSDYNRSNLLEAAGMRGDPVLIDRWKDADCNRDFCTTRLVRGGRIWWLLISRSPDYPAERDLAAACRMSDIAIAARRLPSSCKPRWLKLDRSRLEQDGGILLFLDQDTPFIETVSERQGDHGWYRGPSRAASATLIRRAAWRTRRELAKFGEP